GFTGSALVVFGGLGLFMVSQAGTVKGVRGHLRPVMITIGSQFVGFDGEWKVGLFFARRADFQLGLGTHVTVRAVLDNFFVEARSAIHRGKQRNITPKPEPFAAEVTIGDFKLAMKNFLVIGDFGEFFDELLIFFKG